MTKWVTLAMITKHLQHRGVLSDRQVRKHHSNLSSLQPGRLLKRKKDAYTHKLINHYTGLSPINDVIKRFCHM
ncbi:MAG TPA: hypothetical protein VEZ13_19655 [Brevibacillus sp.]|nr:hypothetical protein [Brevibacillus sp.]